MAIDQDLPCSSITNCCRSPFLSTVNVPMQKQSSPEETNPEKSYEVSRIRYIRLFGKWVPCSDTSGIMIGVDNYGKSSFDANKDALEKMRCKKLTYISPSTQKRSRTQGSRGKNNAASLTINVNAVSSPKFIRLFGKWIECSQSSRFSMAVQDQGKKGWTSSSEAKDNNDGYKLGLKVCASSRAIKKSSILIGAINLQNNVEVQVGAFDDRLGQKVLRKESHVDSSSRLLMGKEWASIKLMPLLDEEAGNLCNSSQGAQSSRVSMAVQNQGKKCTSSLEAKDNNDDKELGLKVCSMAIKKSSTLIGEIGLENTREVQNNEQRDFGVFLGQKVLTKSDIDSSSRLLMGRDLVQTKIIPLLNEEVAKLCNTLQGAEIRVWDLDTRTEHSLVLKRWSTNSFVFTGSWRKDFVRRRNLKKDEKIGLYWDQAESKINFTVGRQI